MGRQYARRTVARFCLAGAHHQGARTVAEQHTGRPVVPIEYSRKRFRANDNGAIGLSQPDEVIGHGQRIDEARTHRLNVERSAAADAEFGLNFDRSGWKRLIRRRRRDDDEVDVRCIDTRAFKRSFGGPGSQIRRVLAGRGNMALLNPRTVDDPVVRRIDELGKIAICDDALWQVRTPSGNA